MLKRYLLVLSLLLIAVVADAQYNSVRHPRVSLNYGSAFTIGPELSFLKPRQYSFNLDYRFWLRIVRSNKHHAFDHTLLLSTGYCFAEREHLLRLRAGDLINLSRGSITVYRFFRLGINAELLLNKNNRVWLANAHLGYRFMRFYYYAGVSYPVQIRTGSIALKPNIFAGISFYLREINTFVN